MPPRKRRHDEAKSHWVHYTPAELAEFLAQVTLAEFIPADGPIRVLDPACGAGELLRAVALAAPESVRRRMSLEGLDTSSSAIAMAQEKLNGLGQIVLQKGDFLVGAESPAPQYDLIIANPPYVRTQVLGARRAQELAREFGLTGRVDLSFAFVRAMAQVLKPGGVLGLLTSNRFLTTRSGASLRQLFQHDFELRSIYDLGDSRPFRAAVLPVIVVGRKGRSSDQPCAFHRVSEDRGQGRQDAPDSPSLLQRLCKPITGTVNTPTGWYRIERGTLTAEGGAWSLATTESNDWIETVRKHQAYTFGALGKVRVGLKTTADEVFIRVDWQSLPEDKRPEPALIRPLLTHHAADRWLARPPAKFVLYPHVSQRNKRVPIDLAEYPRAAAYLEAHRDRLASRRYLSEAGRQWYEIWVPHQPDDWAKPKIAYPDISENPRFFFDDQGTLINGDCYWITLQHDIDPDWLFLMLAVANSTLITKFYDLMFHNKLYAGRRRFMTQYVEKFPLPDLARCHRIVQEVMSVLRSGRSETSERLLDRLVWEAFGLGEEHRSDRS